MDYLPTGYLRTIKLPVLFRYLQRDRKTGILKFCRNDQERSIYLKRGYIIFATSKYEDDRLGEVLLRNGKITLEQYEASVELLKATGKRQGAILVEQGFISAKDLFSVVINQVKEIALSLFTWIDGEYRFIEGDPPSDEVITLKISTGNLILDGIKRIKDWTRLSKEIPSRDSILQLGTDPRALFQDIQLAPKEHELLNCIDRKRTIRDLFKVSSLPPLPTLQMIYFFLSLGIVEVSAGSPELQRTESVGIPPEEEKPARVEEVILSAVTEEKREDIEDSKDEVFQRAEEEHRANREKIQQVYEAMPNQNHYQVLNLHREATRDEIKRAYFALAKEYHPDRHIQAGMEDLQDNLEALFTRITQAYDTLLLDQTRKEYDLSLAMGSFDRGRRSEPGPQVSTEQQAAQLYQRARGAHKSGDLAQVVYCMEWALRLMPDKVDYHYLLGLALTESKGKLREAEETFKKAIDLDPANPVYYIGLGLVYKKGGLKSRAMTQFQEALKWSPDNKQAQQEMQQMKKT